MRRLPRIAIAAVAASTVGGFALTGTASAAPARTTLTGSVPSWASSHALKGAAKTTDTVGFRIYLGWRNSAQAEALAKAVSTPGTAQYGKYLTPAQFRQQFAPTQADVSAVQNWLRSSGFTVDYTPTNNHYVAAEGTVAQANAAFGTTLGSYSYQGKTLRAPESTLSVPAGLPNVSGVVGLDDSAALVHTDHVVADAPPSDGFRNAQPMSEYFGQKTVKNTPTPDGTVLPKKPDYSFAPQGYDPQQIRGAYGLTDMKGGTGVTVAIIDAYASPTILDDVNRYSSDHGLPTMKAPQFTQVVAPGTYKRPENRAQDPQGWYGEETLDVEAVHTTAPGANIVYVGSPNNYQDMDAALNHVVDRKLADIVTNSYGWSGEALPNGYVKPQEDTLVQAAAEGIGVYFSSGDSGDETGGVKGATASPDWPASSPWVTAVGGTSLAVGQNDDYLFETGWETGKETLTKAGAWTAPKFQYGSGGGTSRLFTQPDYQKGVVPTAIATANGGSTPMRTVPDVSALGDPNTGMLVGQTQSWPDGTTSYDVYRIGGTSLASPLFAGMMADAQQLKGSPIGFANPALYAAAGSTAYHDVKGGTPSVDTGADNSGVVRSDYVNGVDPSGGYVYSVRLLGWDSALTIRARDGYDDVTGVGSPTGSAFLGAVAGYTGK